MLFKLLQRRQCGAATETMLLKELEQHNNLFHSNMARCASKVDLGKLPSEHSKSRREKISIHR